MREGRTQLDRTQLDAAIETAKNMNNPFEQPFSRASSDGHLRFQATQDSLTQTSRPREHQHCVDDRRVAATVADFLAVHKSCLKSVVQSSWPENPYCCGQVTAGYCPVQCSARKGEVLDLGGCRVSGRRLNLYGDVAEASDTNLRH